MKGRGIIMQAESVRGILDGRKTKTRRLVKPGKDRDFGCPLLPNELAGEVNAGYYGNCPYGQPGERLWVKETFKNIASGEVKNGYGEVRYGFAYKADGATVWAPRPTIIHDLTNQPSAGPMQFKPRRWKSPIFMPKLASRILLEITDIRVERLQDISEEDAIAEGIEPHYSGWKPYNTTFYEADGVTPANYLKDPRHSYRQLWEKINGAGSWDANPWVWAISFRRIES